MRSVQEQLALVTSAAVAPRPVRVPITEAQGLLCAEEVVAQQQVPAYDQAAIDGYAVRSVDIATAGRQASPVSLPVVGEVLAGSRQPLRLQPRQSVYIETGAPIPTLADAVLPVGRTDGGRARVVVNDSVRSGEFVRRAGDDVQPGDTAVRAGTVIGSAQVALLAAVGHDKVLVHPKPRLSVITIGAELVDLGRTPGPGQTFDVNSYAIAAAARDAGADVNRVGITSLDNRTLRDVIEGQLIRSEIVVIAGALSGSLVQRVKEVLGDLGELDTTRVAMHPGSAQGFGQLGRDNVPTFLLPGNPLSALVIFEVMVRPLIRIALGRRQPMRRLVTARTVAPVESLPGRQGYIRGQLMRDDATGDFLVQPLGTSHTDSNALTTLAEANCLIVIEPEVTSVATGKFVDVSFLAQRM